MNPTSAQTDAFTPYEAGLRELLEQLAPDHPRYAEALVYQQRLSENIALARRYGDQEARRAERAEIVDRLNALALVTLERSFNALAGVAAPADELEAIYRARLAQRHRKLDFVGIPDLKEQPPITLGDIFVPLRAERAADVAEIAEELLAERQSQSPADLGNQREFLGARSREQAPLSRALREARRLVVLGDPGAGKTTLLRYLTVICAEQRTPAELGFIENGRGPLLPIFAPLQQFAATAASRQNYSLLDFFETYAAERLLVRMPPGFFEQALQSGRCIICLDGLDEVWALSQRAAVRDAVAALAAGFPDNRYIVTSRLVGYGQAPLDRRDFVHYTVLPLSDADIRQFVGKWYTQHERDPVQRRQQRDSLIDAIEQEPHIQTLARNPLLLTIIALVHRAEAELPRRRVRLYGKCVTALIETREKVKGLAIDERRLLSYSEQRQLLERLAYTLHTRAEQAGETQVVLEGDLELLLTGFLLDEELAESRATAAEKARAFVELTKQRAGLLIERGDGVFDFAHPTFREYLAACDILTHNILGGAEAIWREIAPRLHVAHWREALLLLLGLLNRYAKFATLLVERILQAGAADPYEPTLHRHLFLAARILADRVDLAAPLRRRIVDGLFQIIGSSPWWEREDAFAALAELDSEPYAAERLLTLANDRQASAGIRRAAAEALGQIGGADEARTVLRALGRDARIEATVRYSAARGLEQLGRPKDAAAVLLGLTRDERAEPTVRRSAAEALARLGRVKDAQVVGLALAAEKSDERKATMTFVLPGDDTAALLALVRDANVSENKRFAAYQRLKRVLEGQT
jgi:energy-coupling factor transporter ATP-binding protein EcfA2